MPKLLAKKLVHGYKFAGQRFDCVDKAGFLMANISFALERPDINA